MGRRKGSRKSRKSTKKAVPKRDSLTLRTKKEMASEPKPSSYVSPDISIKVRRNLARRSADRNPARPLFYQRKTTLSRLYNKDHPDDYMKQVFSSITKIGQGCFGDVFEVVSRENGRQYAIKVTNDTHSFTDKDEVRRFEKVPSNPYCLRFYKAWQQSRRVFIQMELCIASLDKLLVVDHHIKEPQCWDILTDLGLGLKHLHDNRLVHFDIKPANVMFSASGVCKLGDFGLLADLKEDIDPETQKRVGKCVLASEGDGKYVATEVLQKDLCTPAGDIFSLGLMMLEVASDAALPSSGSGWRLVRCGKLPECYLERDLSSNFRNLIESMISADHISRPSIDDVLREPIIQQVLFQRKQCPRINYMANWHERWQAYLDSNREPEVEPVIPDPIYDPAVMSPSSSRSEFNWDIPAVEGPSPPRRNYPINYISPKRVPLEEICLNDFVFSPMTRNSNDITSTSAGASKEERYKRVSRKLF